MDKVCYGRNEEAPASFKFSRSGHSRRDCVPLSRKPARSLPCVPRCFNEFNQGRHQLFLGVMVEFARASRTGAHAAF